MTEEREMQWTIVGMAASNNGSNMVEDNIIACTLALSMFCCMLLLLVRLLLLLFYSSQSTTLAKVVLITQLYREENVSRHNEILAALTQNILNPYIDEIHLLQHDTLVHLCEKVKIKSHVESRLSFGGAIEYANQIDLKGSIVVMSNNDIVFDESLRWLHDPLVTRMLARFESFCLSRHEPPEQSVHGIGTQCGPGYIGSHDVFIAHSPLPNHLASALKTVFFGQAGADARFIYEARRAGLVVSNPCKSIRAVHWHRSGKRSAALPEANLDGRSDVAFPDSLPLHDDHIL
jgi:hypothetical protein